MYTRFQSSYYNCKSQPFLVRISMLTYMKCIQWSSYYNRESQSFLTQNKFKLKAPNIVVDLSLQNESVNTGPIDQRISKEWKTPSHENFC